MPSFNWTNPEVMYEGGQKSLSVYIKELQDAIDVRRSEIGQSPYIGFRNANVDTTMAYDTLVQLKVVTNTLAVDFGYVGGVAHQDLLGRGYTTYGIRYGKFLFSFPIINDLRLVLNRLEDQNAVVDTTIGTFIYSWFSSTQPKPIGGYKFQNTKPWLSVPDVIQLGTGTICEESYPTCDNNIGGAYTGIPRLLTDRSLISIDTTGTYYMEGAVGGDYEKVSDSTGDITLLGPTLFDKDWVYSTSGNGGSGGVVLRAARDGSVHRYAFGDFGEYFFGSGGAIGAGIIGDNLIYTFAQNLTTNIKVGIMNKNTGAVIVIKNYNHQDLQNSGATHNIDVDWGSGRVANGIFYVSYKEYMNNGDLGANRTHYASSCIVGFNSTGDIVSRQYISTTSLVHPYTPSDTIRYMHEIGDVTNSTSTGIYYYKSKNGEVITVNTPIVNLGNYLNYDGVSLGLEIGVHTDYKSDTLTNIDTFMHSSAYTQHAGATPDVVPSELLTYVRNPAGTEIAVTFKHTSGNFSYQLYKRDEDVGVFSVSTALVTSKEAFDAGTFSRTMTGFNDEKGYYIKLVSISAQGEQDSTILYFPPAPVKPGKPTNLVVTIVGGNTIQYTWDNPIDGEPHTGFRILYNPLAIIGGTVVVDVGLVNTYITPVLSSGNYLVGVEAYNTFGDSGYLASSILVP